MTVSVIITCYNHGKYLEQAIQTVIGQNFSDTEIIVVDDGSVDNTGEVSRSFPLVKYVYQQNSGLSAARNAGIENATGEFLIFLDADDWLLPEAISTNIAYLLADPELIFVSGSHAKYLEANGGLIEEKIVRLKSSDYNQFLRGNLVAMHAAVMYRRRAFDEVRFDTTLPACEDYDVYLKLSRKHKVTHHEKPVAMYRIHASNMSGDYMLMLNAALQVLNRQKEFIETPEQQAAFDEGIVYWTKSYTGPAYISMVERLKRGKPIKKEDEALLLSLSKWYYLKYLLKKLIHGF